MKSLRIANPTSITGSSFFFSAHGALQLLQAFPPIPRAQSFVTPNKMADGKVKILSTGLVQAADHDEKHNKPFAERIPLTPCDLRLILLGTFQKGLLFHKPTNPPIQTLKSSFSRALASFYPFAGRFSVDKHPDDDGTASVFIDCNNAGALFAHAVADSVSISDILEPLYVPPVLWSLFPLNWVRNYHGFSEPFLAVQVTELVDGIFVGCTINHTVADETTFWMFMNFWSQICRSELIEDYSSDKYSGSFTRNWFLDEKHSPPIRFPSTMVNYDLKDDYVPPPLRERVFHFSRKKLAVLKEQANAEAGGGGKISSLQSLIAHIWRAAIRNRENPDPDRKSRFFIAIGLRSRLGPEFAENYFGNAIVGSFVVLDERDLLVAEKGLGHVAAEVNKVVAGQTNEKLKEAMESWIENPQFLKMGEFVEGMLGMSSSPRFDVYGNDFGWGKPVAVRSGGESKSDGKVTVLPGVEAGSMAVEICLSPEAAERLGSDLEFMAAVGV